MLMYLHCIVIRLHFFSQDNGGAYYLSDQIVGYFRCSVPYGKRGLPLEVALHFPNGFSGKMPFYLTFNRSFRIFLLRGKGFLKCYSRKH